MGQGSRRRFFGVIQLGRWAAAFAVLCYHASQSLAAFASGTPPWIATLFSGGFLGVDFFFVLSGFIIYHAHRGDERSAPALARFYCRRFVRIYAPYLPIAVALVAAYRLLPGLSAGGREWSLLKTLTLLPLGGDVALSVAWTLVHEVVFYAIFGVLFYGRVLAVGSAAWAAGIVAYNALGMELGPVHDVVFHALNLEFLLGLAAAHLLGTLSGRSGPGLLVGGALVAVPVLVMAPAGPARLLFGLGMALVILGAALCEREGRLRAPSVSVLLGASSYALYLLHVPMLSVLVRLAVAMGLGWAVILPACLALCCIAALVYYRLVERPLLVGLGAASAHRVDDAPDPVDLVGDVHARQHEMN